MKKQQTKERVKTSTQHLSGEGHKTTNTKEEEGGGGLLSLTSVSNGCENVVELWIYPIC